MKFRRLWNEQAAVIDAAQLILMTVLLIVGVLVGLQTVRDSVVQEFGDLSAALESLNQSYSFSIITGPGGVFRTSTFTDFPDNTSPVSASDPVCTTTGFAPATSESNGGGPPADIGFAAATPEQ